MLFEELDEYIKDVKKLTKRYRTLIQDIEIVKKILIVNPKEKPPFSYRINNLGIETCIVKVKKIASRSFKGKGIHSGFRLVYALFNNENKIIFIEIYHKSNKENEDRERILKNFE
ncbi:MAG: hypothetical protein KAI81_05265 [Candidatus Marinimicrobia bacterium]|nr:hypothetical protein [Candidatus Neomarinimicrobiota bacterium]